MIEGRVVTDHSLCSSCFECVDICPHDAHKSFGQEMTDSQVFDEISKDEVFFFHSGGGVTISGGECLCQPDFVISVLKKCRIRGIFTAIETSLSVSWEIIENVLPFIDNLYVDIKHLDTRMHKKFVGVNNKLILSNLEKLDRSELPFDLHIRIPLIPGVNDDDASLLALIPVMKSLKRLTDIEILPYHRLGVGTYAQLGKDYKFEGLQPPTEEYIAERIEFLSKQELTVPLRIAGGA